MFGNCEVQAKATMVYKSAELGQAYGSVAAKLYADENFVKTQGRELI